VARPTLRAADRALLAAAVCHRHAPRAARAWELRGRCCAGIARLCAGSGDSRAASVGGRPSRLKWARSCCGWLARIRAGAIGGSAASSPSSARTLPLAQAEDPNGLSWRDLCELTLRLEFGPRIETPP
jgi:hypothetical protein